MSTSRPKAVYFLYYAAIACLAPFMTLYYQQRGMTGAQIGILAGLVPLLTLVSSPFWSGIADATRRHRAVLLLTIAGLWITVLVLFFATTFTELLILIIAYAFFIGPIVPLIDNAVMDLLRRVEGEYGRVRVWGALGWGVAATALAPFLQRVGLSWSFYGCLLFMAACFVVATGMPMEVTGVRHAYTRGLNVLLRRGRFLLLLFVALLYGVSIGVLLSYQFLYLEELGGSRSLMAFSLVVSTLSEIPFWFISGTLLRRYGVNRMIAFALGATTIRMFALAVMGGPWLILPISLLHGPSFAVMWAAGVADADALAPAGLGATAQGLFSSSLLGLGAALGGFLGGPLYELIGFKSLFTWLGFLTIAALVIFVIARLATRARQLSVGSERF